MSSTTGIQISMRRFDQVSVDYQNGRAIVGAGCLWDQVYLAVRNAGYDVVGGATSEGVGMHVYMQFPTKI